MRVWIHRKSSESEFCSIIFRLSYVSQLGRDDCVLSNQRLEFPRPFSREKWKRGHRIIWLSMRKDSHCSGVAFCLKIGLSLCSRFEGTRFTFMKKCSFEPIKMFRKKFPPEVLSRSEPKIHKRF